MGDVFQFLKSTTVESVMLPIAEVHSVQETDLLRDAYKILVEKNILSVPVMKNGEVTSFLDQIDILHLACEVCVLCALFFVLANSQNHDLKEATCAQACNHSKQCPFVTINKDMNLIKLCEKFCISHPDLPRYVLLGKFHWVLSFFLAVYLLTLL
jgi:signal-transduction protein with cAMP-binding, CBS, and nucleotidyltransferase domain